VRYAFIREQQAQHAVRTLCRMMRVHPSGYYAWLATPQSRRRREDEALLGHIKHSWLAGVRHFERKNRHFRPSSEGRFQSNQ